MATIGTTKEVPKKFIQIKPWLAFQLVMTVLICLGVIITLVYISQVVPLIQKAANVFPSMPSVNMYILYFHIATAIPPLLLGVVAFSSKIRSFYPHVHRWVGTAYCALILWSSFAGIALATANTRGIIAQMGFGLLGFMWFITTLMAYIAARNKQFFFHRRWMIRSYALTLAVVSVRPMFWWPPSFIPPETWYLIITWLCWVPNLLIGEIYARCTNVSGKLKKNSAST